MVMVGDQLVSVIICYYLEQEIVYSAIDSVICQSYDNLEIILVCDGGDKDYFENLRHHYHFDKRIRAYWKTNSGLTKSLLFAIEKCKGDIIARIDADDTWVKRKIEYQIPYLERYDVVASWISQEDREGRKVGSYIDINFNCNYQRSLLLKNSIVHSSVLLKKEQYKRLNSRFKYAQDYALWIELLSKGMSFYIVEKELVKRKILPDSIGVRKRSQQQYYVLLALILNFKFNFFYILAFVKHFFRYVFYLFSCVY